jgi:hypothetical protein
MKINKRKSVRQKRKSTNAESDPAIRTLAALLKCSPVTIRRRMAASPEDRKALLSVAERKRQFDIAMSDSPEKVEMLVKLGKEHLGQTGELPAEAELEDEDE